MKGCGKPAKARCRGTFSEIDARRKGKACRLPARAGFDPGPEVPIFRPVDH